jgi:hypothetical protein
MPLTAVPAVGGADWPAWSRIVPKIESVPSWLSKTWSRRLCCGQSASAATRMLQKATRPSSG